MVSVNFDMFKIRAVVRNLEKSNTLIIKYASNHWECRVELQPWSYIIRIFDVLPYFPFTTSEMKPDY